MFDFADYYCCFPVFSNEQLKCVVPDRQDNRSTSIVLWRMCGGDKSMSDKRTPTLGCSKRYNRQHKIGLLFWFFWFFWFFLPYRRGAGSIGYQKNNTFSIFESSMSPSIRGKLGKKAHNHTINNRLKAWSRSGCRKKRGWLSA